MKFKVDLISILFQKIPKMIRGRWRLAKILLGRSIDGPGNIKTSDGIKLTAPSLRDPIAFSILVDGSYEQETFNVIEEYLPANGVFIDIGANIGLFTIQAAKYLKGQGQVIAIEASNVIFPYLKKNVRLTEYENIDCIHVAATDCDFEDIEFYEAPKEKFGMGSIAPQFNSSPISIIGRTLDSLLEELSISHVDVIKVDVEGFEAAVFRGAKNILNNTKKPVLVFEFLDWAEGRSGEKVGEAQRILMKNGYSLQLICNRKVNEVDNEFPLLTGGGMILATHA